MAKQTIADFVGEAEYSRLHGRLGVDSAQGFPIGEPATAAAPLAREATLCAHATEVPPPPNPCGPAGRARVSRALRRNAFIRSES